MNDQQTTPPYAVELARIAMFTIAQVQARHGASLDGRPVSDIPDEKDFELTFGLYLKRLVLESEIRGMQADKAYQRAIDRVEELDEVQKKIDALEAAHNLSGLVRTWRNPGAVKP